MKRNRGFDTIGVLALGITFVSLLISFNLSFSDIVLSVSVFVLIVAVYFYFSIKGIVDSHGEEIRKLHEKVNIYKDIAYLKSMIELKFGKRGEGDVLEVFLRAIQIGGIVFAVYIILKAVGFSF